MRRRLGRRRLSSWFFARHSAALPTNIGPSFGGLLIAIFVGHVMSAKSIADELGWHVRSGLFSTWRYILR
ncbi:MAG: hypothetical protein AAFX92_04905 [Pseudomonadota bacterium]